MCYRYILYIDAGAFGSLENAKYLSATGRQFIMSVASNRGQFLWRFLQAV